jgi:hypothetical protein
MTAIYAYTPHLISSEVSMVRPAPVVAVLGLLVLACHTITEDLPTTSRGPTAPQPIPVIVVPVPIVTPTPAPAPTATPNAPNTPGGTPPPAPSGTSCGLPPGTGSGANCPYKSASFQNDVERAIDNTIAKYPSLFDKRDDRCPSVGNGCPRILNPEGYWNAVTAEIQKLGYCAVNDGEELAVKNTNSFNDQYDVFNGEGYVRRGSGSYRSTCYPAWF